MLHMTNRNEPFAFAFISQQLTLQEQRIRQFSLDFSLLFCNTVLIKPKSPGVTQSHAKPSSARAAWYVNKLINRLISRLRYSQLSSAIQLIALCMYCQQLTFIYGLFQFLRRLRLWNTIFRRGRRHCCLKKSGNDVS